MSVIHETESHCPFCKEKARKWATNNEFELYGFECCICNMYFISSELLNEVKEKEIDNGLLNCIHENIRSNPSKHPIITSWHLKSDTLPSLASDITVKRFEDFARLPIGHANKPLELLKVMAIKTSETGPFSKVRFELKDLYRLKILDFREAWQWLITLMKNESITIPRYHKPKDKPKNPFAIVDYQDLKETDELSNEHMPHIDFSLTTLGWDSLHQHQTTVPSQKVFIAMQFKWEDDLLKNKFVEAVKDACKICGYDADIVNQNHLNQITDEIIANIKESHFVIADFTYNNRGAYYEAGLARGLGIPVLHTVMVAHDSDLHFDIKQINYIQWETPDDLKQKLVFRIKAVIDSEV